MAYEEAFREENGDRYDVPNYAVIITDGESTVEPEMTLPEAIEVILLYIMFYMIF